MALIGTSNWDPTGESGWSIVTRLSQRNYLNWVEVRRLFGAKELRSFATPEAQDPDDSRNFSIPALCVTTGWSTEVLKASFSKWYQPPWLSDEKPLRLRKSGRYLRACPACLFEGSHLLLHQLLDWVRCPIHDESLTTRCPKCRNLLGRFSITKDLERRGGYCQHCHELLLNVRSKSADQTARRLRFVKDYDQWMKELHSAFDASAGRFRWLGHDATMQELVHLHKLVPGPSWVNHCMANASKVRASSWTWTGAPLDDGRTARSHRIPIDPVRLKYGHHGRRIKSPAIVDDFSRFLASGVQKHYGRLVEEFGLSCRNSGMREWNSTECTPMYGEQVDAWDTGYWMWRRSMDEAFPFRQRWTRSRTLEPMEMSWMWDSWVRSVGNLIWAPLKSLRRPYNAAFVRWLTKIWLLRECEEHLALFVGVACRKVGGDWMNTNWLVGEVWEVGNPSFWVREKDKKGNDVVHALATVAPLDCFLELKRAGFTGTDDNYLQSFERLRPLIDLLGTHPQNVGWWEEHWRKTQRRQRERRSALLSSRKTSDSEMHDIVSAALSDPKVGPVTTAPVAGGHTLK